ncbi:cytochrome p450 71c4 [Hordeum vulgare]|nr:cytochrome p450 71c4 [Hordeum vulgare]
MPRSTPAPSPRRRVGFPVHQAQWHWEQRVSLPYPDVTLPHDWHLDPKTIPVPVVPRSARVHAEEVSRRRRVLTPEQWQNPAYADSPNWELWIVVEHKEQRRRGVRDVQPGGPPPPPPVVSDEDQEAEAAY